MAINFDKPMLLNQKPLPVNLCVATGFFQRLRGLLFTDTLNNNQGLYIKPCRDVHSIGMAYSLDVVFLDKDSRVIKLAKLPVRSMQRCQSAAGVVELPEGSIKQLGIQLSDRITYKD